MVAPPAPTWAEADLTSVFDFDGTWCSIRWACAEPALSLSARGLGRVDLCSTACFLSLLHSLFSRRH